MDFNVQTKISLDLYANGIVRKHDEHVQPIWDLISDQVGSYQRSQRKSSKINESCKVSATKSLDDLEESCTKTMQAIH